MYDPDRDDPEWDEEVQRGQQQAHHLSSSSSSSSPHLRDGRLISPLPKRQRLSQQQGVGSKVQKKKEGRAVGKQQGRGEEDDEEQEERIAPGVGHADVAREPALEYRLGADDDYHGQKGGTASNHPSKAREEEEEGEGTKSSTIRPEEEQDDFDRPRHLEESPCTSPATSRAGQSFQEEEEPQEELERGPDHFALFGSEGDQIRRSLLKASTFSSAGLCGGLGLAALHPSLAPPPEKTSRGATAGAEGDARGGDEDEVDDDGYAMVERAYTSEHGGRLVPVVRGAGNNKKKRKIPGVSVGTGGDDDEDRTFDAEDGPEPTTVIGPDKKGRAPGLRSDFGTGPVTSKAPVNPPTTAKAALAKLRLRPSHVSLVPLALSHRRASKRHHRAFVAKYKPLKLPPAPFHAAPAILRDGPPPLPPGSGLKGSRALKAAKKAEKDREREKERMKELLGGSRLRLIDLWDPEGKEESAAAIERANRRRRLGLNANLKTAYPTPPGSADGDRHPLPPSLDSFEFVEPPPPVVGARWRALVDQIERFRLAKERAAKAREEEKERRKEKEKELTAQETEHAAAAAAASTSAVVKKAPPHPAAGKRIPVAAIRPPVEPSVSSPSRAFSDRSNNLPVTSPTTYTHEPPSLLPPSTRKPVKKGKKKRSAHANALNVHHRDNYVPSRMPASSYHHNQSSQYDGSTTPPLTSWPASAEAIAAAGGSRPDTSYFAGGEEWLCAFCEYDLFYGKDPSKAVSKRKGVLKVRKKARERASKAAAGSGTAPVGGGGGGEEQLVGDGGGSAPS